MAPSKTSKLDKSAPYVITLAGVATVALGSLLTEDILPNSTDIKPSYFQVESPDNLIRVLFFVVSLTLLVIFLRVQLQRKKKFGTFYYLELQASGVLNLHLEAIAREGEAALDYRSVSRVFEAISPVTDITRDVEYINDELERESNTDDDDSAFRVAPNLIAPAALGVGYGWLPRATAQLEEYAVKPGQQQVSAVREAPENQFTLDVTALYSAEPPSDVLVAVDQVGQTGWQRAPEKIEQRTGITSVFLTIIATEPREEASHRSLSQVFNRNTFAEQSAIRRIVTAKTIDIADINAPLPTIFTRNQPSTVHQGTDVTLSPVELTNGLRHWIQRTHYEFPDAAILLLLRAPKAVAVATGWLLRNERPPLIAIDKKTTPRQPWDRLVPLGYFEPPALIPLRVRSAQPDPVATLTNAGIRVPGTG